MATSMITRDVDVFCTSLDDHLKTVSELMGDMVKHELRVTSYELRVTSYELRVTSYELRVES